MSFVGLTTLLVLLFVAFALGVIVLTLVPMAGMLLMVAENGRKTLEMRRARNAALGLTKRGGDLVGVVDGRAVRISNKVVSSGKASTTWWTVSVVVPEVRGHVAFAPVGPLGSVRRTTGDPAFDQVLRVPSGHPLALAWLDAPTRALLGQQKAKLHDGTLSTRSTTEPRVTHIRALVQAANRMAAVEPVAALAEIAATDAPLVRVKALGALAGVDRERASELARDAARSTVREERALGVVLVRDADDLRARIAAGPDEERHELFEALSEFGTPALVAAAAHAMSAGPLTRPLWFVLTAAVAAHPSRAAVDAVWRRADQQLDADGEFAADRLLVVTTSLGDSNLEAGIASVLSAARQEAGRGLRWLAEHGTVASVPAIDALLAQTWPLTGLREEATTAKRSIQDRATGARGGLALAADTGGGLMEAVEVAGGLTEATTEEATDRAAAHRDRRPLAQ